MHKKPLFIYDWYNTVEAPLFAFYMIEQHHEKIKAHEKGRQYVPTRSWGEFKKIHNNRKTLLVPGMEELIRFTDSIGNNVLISDGHHLEDACPELLALSNCFKTWTYNGKLVEFGGTPEGKSKSNPEIADALLAQFNPNKVIVIGDSNTEAKFAEFLRADTFIYCGLDNSSLVDGKNITNTPNLVTGTPIKDYIYKRVQKEDPHLLYAIRERVRS